MLLRLVMWCTDKKYPVEVYKTASGSARADIKKYYKNDLRDTRTVQTARGPKPRFEILTNSEWNNLFA